MVTDGDERASLAVVRSLGRAGYTVVVCSSTGQSLAGASRYASADHRVPDPLEEPAAFIRRVRQLIDATSANVLLPVTDAAMLALLPRSDLPTETVLPFGPDTAFRALSDKENVWDEARELGLSVPEQRVLRDPECTSANVPWEDVVVKPARSVVGNRVRRARCSVRYATRGDALRAVLESMDPAAFPLLLQERIRGPGVGLFLLRWGGATRAVFAHRRLREKPPRGGVSVYRESVTAPPELVQGSERLLEAYDWTGVAMVEFKVADETHVPYLMEVNPRFWGSLQLAIDAGVDFPRLLVEAALGAPPHSPPSYRMGVRTRWLWGDVDHLLARLKGAESYDRRGRSADRIRAVAEFLKLWRPGDHYEVLQLNDPSPFARETARWVSSAWRSSPAP